jgi:hypothetical protein
MPARKKAARRPASRKASQRRAAGVRFVVMDDGYLAFRGQVDRVHRLNESAALVLDLCNGARSLDRIAALVAEAYGLKTPPVADVRAVVARMARLDLVKGDPPRAR